VCRLWCFGCVRVWLCVCARARGARVVICGLRHVCCGGCGRWCGVWPVGSLMRRGTAPCVATCGVFGGGGRALPHRRCSLPTVLRAPGCVSLSLSVSLHPPPPPSPSSLPPLFTHALPPSLPPSLHPRTSVSLVRVLSRRFLVCCEYVRACNLASLLSLSLARAALMPAPRRCTRHSNGAEAMPVTATQSHTLAHQHTALGRQLNRRRALLLLSPSLSSARSLPRVLLAAVADALGLLLAGALHAVVRLALLRQRRQPRGGLPVCLCVRVCVCACR